MDSHNKESRNVRGSGQCKGLPEGTRAPASALALTARTFIVCPCCENRGTLFPAHGRRHGGAAPEWARTRIRFFGTTRPASTHAVFSALLAFVGCLERVERARSRDVQGGAAGPRSGRKRSGPRSSPLAAAATTPLRFRRDELLRRYRSANHIHQAFPCSLWFAQFDERPHHSFTPPSRARSLM